MRTIPALALSLLATTLLTGCAGGPADAAATVDTTAISHTDFAARLGTVTDNTVLSRWWENLGWTLNLLVEHGCPDARSRAPELNTRAVPVEPNSSGVGFGRPRALTSRPPTATGRWASGHAGSAATPVPRDVM